MWLLVYLQNLALLQPRTSRKDCEFPRSDHSRRMQAANTITHRAGSRARSTAAAQPERYLLRRLTPEVGWGLSGDTNQQFLPNVKKSPRKNANFVQNSKDFETIWDFSRNSRINSLKSVRKMTKLMLALKIQKLAKVREMSAIVSTIFF